MREGTLLLAAFTTTRIWVFIVPVTLTEAWQDHCNTTAGLRRCSAYRWWKIHFFLPSNSQSQKERLVLPSLCLVGKFCQSWIQKFNTMVGRAFCAARPISQQDRICGVFWRGRLACEANPHPGNRFRTQCDAPQFKWRAREPIQKSKDTRIVFGK